MSRLNANKFICHQHRQMQSKLLYSERQQHKLNTGTRGDPAYILCSLDALEVIRSLSNACEDHRHLTRSCEFKCIKAT